VSNEVKTGSFGVIEDEIDGRWKILGHIIIKVPLSEYIMRKK
jgi:hypothetical protein